MTTHTVEQGECLLSIAHLYGFSDWRTLYDHPDNKSLRELRPDPNLLLPGDTLVIPERRARQERMTTGKTHRFEVVVPKTFLHLDIRDCLDGQATQVRYSLEVEGVGKPLQGEVGADGKLDVQIPARARNATLTLLRPKTDHVLAVLQLELGALDPLSTLSGIRQRLQRLGFSCTEGNGQMDPLTRAAVSAFQRRYQLPVDGIPGKQTQAKLAELVGI